MKIKNKFSFKNKVPNKRVWSFMGDRTLGEADSYSGDSTWDVFWRGRDRNFNAKNYLNCTYIIYTCIIRSCLLQL